MQIVSGAEAKRGREYELTRETGRKQWRTQYIGTRTREIGLEPQAFLAEMGANGLVVPHFHEVNQFQVLIAGSGSLGRSPITTIALHYADNHTAYGPIQAGPAGLSFFTIRAQSDSRPVYLHSPDYKSFLKPSKRRYLLATDIVLSTEPVLQHRTEVALESLLKDADFSDGLGVYMLRLGADMKAAGPDPKTTSCQYYLVVGGSLEYQDTTYRPWSLAFVKPDEQPLMACAGPLGLEALVLNFPKLAA